MENFRIGIHSPKLYRIKTISQRLIRKLRSKVHSLHVKYIIDRKIGGAAEIDVSLFSTKSKSDINEHLNFLYLLLYAIRPTDILELGTRGGESTKVLERYCSEVNIVGHSFDLSPQPEWLARSNHWKHYEGDDITLGKNLAMSGKWLDGSPFNKLDFIFLDTSHEFLHTAEELKVFIPLLKRGGAFCLHDTNLTASPTRRLDGDLNFGWNNLRGVSRALEEFFEFEFNEKHLQVQVINDERFLFYHQPWNNGFSVLLSINQA
jgi:predicted O-methyltransferase YrrM